MNRLTDSQRGRAGRASSAGTRPIILPGLFLGLAFLMFSAVAFAEVESLPLTIKAHGHSYEFQEFTVGANDKGETSITFKGTGFESMPVKKGQVIVPVWCAFTSGGEEYEWQNVSTGAGTITYYFSTSKAPEIIKLYAEDGREQQHSLTCNH